MNSASPNADWKQPPVIEVVLGVQFDPLPALTNGHLGWFWGEMHEKFPTSDDARPIPRMVEEFGETLFGFAALDLRPQTGDSRIRMSSADRTQMVQVQNGWLIANWMKKQGHDYPGFTGVNKLFKKTSASFATFLDSRELGVLTPNLWEVTYVDHIPKGTVWDSLEDLPRVFPGLFGSGLCPKGSHEAVNATWAWRLGPETPGRLRLSVQSARTSTSPAIDVLLVKSIARGPMGYEGCPSLEVCLNLGRSAVVDTFRGLASDEAKSHWAGSD